MKSFGKILSASIALGLLASCDHDGADKSGVERAYEEAKASEVTLRGFLRDFPKGGDIHTHSFGAVYAETWLRWAAEDGLCINTATYSIIIPEGACAGENISPATRVHENEDLRRKMINALSLRSYVPYNGWSGHNQFFDTFGRMAMKPHRFGDMIAEMADRAGEQNIVYLEIMHTLELENIFPTAIGVEITGDAAQDYEAMMESPFGANLPDMVDRARAAMDAEAKRRNTLLECESSTPSKGCTVEVRFLHQVIRELPPPVVYGQIILGWALMEADDRMVGLNLVAPEDGHVALRDYMTHMREIDYLYRTKGPQNVTLHAGELTLGLVHPNELRSHIRDAINIGHAKRIGHGMDIVYEDNYQELLKQMADNEILVEVNLTSNDVILGVTGDEHPLLLYRSAGVPMTLSTDDEGVSRIDLTHEYVRGVMTYDFSYEEIKIMSKNAIKYSFLNESDKKAAMSELKARFEAFEAKYSDKN